MNNDTLNKHHFYIINEYQTHKLFEERPFDLLLGRLKNLKILWKFIKKSFKLAYLSLIHRRKAKKAEKMCMWALDWLHSTRSSHLKKPMLNQVFKKLPLLTALVVPAILAPILSLTFRSIETRREQTSKLLVCNIELNRL